MLNCFVSQTTKNATPIYVVKQSDFAAWLKQQTAFVKSWLESNGFRGDVGNLSLIPNEKGKLACVLLCIADTNQFWGVGSLPQTLPEGVYYFEAEAFDYEQLAIVWGLGSYQFTRYKKALRAPAQLVLPKSCDVARINNIVESIYVVRDLINTPTEDLGPSEFSLIAKAMSQEFKAQFKEIVGDDLLKQNFPVIHAVGRACDDAPRLIDMRWGNKKHPKITLVGKGVCFDTGGLDLKNSAGMLLMKKDMGGAAHVLGLARMIMRAKLPVCLRVLIPLVENSVSGNAYRPGDVLKSRKGLTIEIGNTDAEGRLVLSDALTAAVEDNPELLIDMATLTGAARVALGTDLPALFSNNDELAHAVFQQGLEQTDFVWRMPLFSAYREALNSYIADINNAGDSYGGAITAALFLREFVPDTIPWLHFDLMAWNLKSRPGRPQGGEAMALRTLFSYLLQRYG
jgi:leucyl aminopeptidase